MAGGYINVSGNELKQVPIMPVFDSKMGREITKLVKTISSMNEEVIFYSLISEINRLVYKVYNLTPEEISVIEGQTFEVGVG